jgi:hypothetical protein
VTVARRAVRAVASAGLAVALLVSSTACSSDTPQDRTATTDPSSFPLQAPTSEQVEAATGLDFPESMADYRSGNSPTAPQLEVGFTMSAAEVESFASASGLTLVPDDRIIIHSSPVWGDQNPPGDLRSGSISKGRYLTKVEIRTNFSETEPDKAAVRVLVTLRQR